MGTQRFGRPKSPRRVGLHLIQKNLLFYLTKTLDFHKGKAMNNDATYTMTTSDAQFEILTDLNCNVFYRYEDEEGDVCDWISLPGQVPLGNRAELVSMLEAEFDDTIRLDEAR